MVIADIPSLIVRVPCKYAAPRFMLPMELLVTIFTFLPSLKAIAVCASVSRLWRQAAGQAMPRVLDFNEDCPKHGSRALALLFERPLGPVEVVRMPRCPKGFTQQELLFARICYQASALQEVTM